MDTTDDFELLGRAVARVLREAFATAGEARERAAQFQAGQSKAFDVELDRVLTEMRALPAKVQAEREAEVARFGAALAAAEAEVASTLAEAREAAEAIRAQAVADASSIVEGAAAEVARAHEVVAEERVRLDAELKALVREVRAAVAKLETSAVGDHSEMLDRASTEARMILRQARLHHRSTAKEVDRMIEAAAAEAASLRKTALADAARIAARVRGVVDVPEGPSASPASSEADVDELPLRGWKRPAVVPVPDPPAETAAEPPRRRGRRLAS
jgi:hypothetical protein